MVFLEVLGYTQEDAKRAGFQDLFALAQQVYQRVEYYDDDSGRDAGPGTAQTLTIPSTRKRLVESLSLATPWLGGLALLYAFGVSLWLAWGLPIQDVTALMIGVLLGLLISEGPLQAFTRIFMFYQNQGNVSECSRALKRSYAAVTLLLAGAVAVLDLSSYYLRIPAELNALAIVGAVTISLHRIGYLPIYALKKTGVIVVSYGIALPLLVAVYEGSASIFPDAVTRYLVAMSAALSVLSVFAWYYSTKSLVIQVVNPPGVPNFYKSHYVNADTIRSRFSIQFWEALPQYLFGTFFFVMIFGDRVLSWLANPIKSAGGVVYPMLFNSVYHAGADLALGILFPVAIVQYVMLSSVHEELHNLSTGLSVTQTDTVDVFLRRKHADVMKASLAVSAVAAILIVQFGPYEIAALGGSATSVHILYFAALGDLLLTVFIVNSAFMMLLNRPKTLAVMTALGAVMVISLGLILTSFGFQYIVLGYLAACVLLATASTAETSDLLKTPASLFYSRFV